MNDQISATEEQSLRRNWMVPSEKPFRIPVATKGFLFGEDMKLLGHPFVNSESCSGKSFVADGQTLDMAEININGRYPETGWAKNEQVGEMVYVLRGMGQLAIRDAEPIELKVGDVVSVSAGQEFFWSGNNLTILMACSPAFSSEQYTVTEEKS